MAHTCTHSTKTELAEEFWAILREDYLPRNKGVSDLKKTQVGTILESEDWWMEWPMGIVTKCRERSGGKGYRDKD